VGNLHYHSCQFPAKTWAHGPPKITTELPGGLTTLSINGVG